MKKKHFDVTAEIELLKQRRENTKRKTCSGGIANYRTEIIAFRKSGKASYRLIAEWLATKKLDITYSTVRRFVKTLSELQESKDAKLP